MTHVRAIPHDDSLVAAQPPDQLSVAHVDSDDTPGAALQEDVGEPAGRCAGVEAPPSPGLDTERVEGSRELVPAAGGPPRTRLDDERVGP
jgi:hypothetical protein